MKALLRFEDHESHISPQPVANLIPIAIACRNRPNEKQARSQKSREPLGSVVRRSPVQTGIQPISV
ncbi:hypothetical protein RISK_006396 [Rhodopirellula islandica]|uniref:Uncharacterized protein n=1 Tax=Rhodopirellula islandica TaxID=595434 RepID=A0A0J1E7V4_RHOIS|nr:hypothetical protein RISK_006396 [Rhodopirellula islandica]